MVEEVFPGMRVVSTNNSKDMIHIPKISSTKISIAQKELNFKIIDSNRTFYVNTMRKKHTIWTKKLIHFRYKETYIRNAEWAECRLPPAPILQQICPFLKGCNSLRILRGKKKRKERKKERRIHVVRAWYTMWNQILIF